MHKGSLTIAWYALTVFASSALLLVLEVVAGRLIAPYVGVSLYTWTAVIGVILAGLSVGNWAGGVLADRGGGEQAAGITLILAALASLAIPLILTVVAPGIQTGQMSLMTASLLLVLSLFFLPALLLGFVTPLLTTLALRLSSRTGHIVGMMHALAAVGSILGTFLTGYWLVQSFGSRAVILGSAFTLGLLGLPLLRRSFIHAFVAAFVLATLVLAATGVKRGFADPCDRESAYFCIRVVSEEWDLPPGELRSLVLDHLLHGSNHSEEAGLLVAPYVHLMDELVLARFPRREDLDFFFIGGGAYTQPRAVRELYPSATVSVAELDTEVTQIARERLFVDTRGMTIQHADARVALTREDDAKFDVIVADAFHDIAIPIHLVTRELAEIVNARLKPNGLYLLNVVDVFPDAKLVKSMIKTLRTVFADVHVWLDEIPGHSSRVTYVVSAGDDHQPPDVQRARRGIPRDWLRVTELLVRLGTPLDQLPLLTDDWAPVEQLMADLFLSPLGR